MGQEFGWDLVWEDAQWGGDYSLSRKVAWETALGALNNYGHHLALD